MATWNYENLIGSFAYKWWFKCNEASGTPVDEGGATVVNNATITYQQPSLLPNDASNYSFLLPYSTNDVDWQIDVKSWSEQNAYKSVSMLVKPVSTNSNDEVFGTISSSDTQGLRIWYASIQNFYLGFYDSAGQQSVMNTDAFASPTGSTYHLAMTWEGQAANDRQSAYVNGIRIGRLAADASWSNDEEPWFHGVEGTDDNAFNGNYQHLIGFTNELTYREIYQQYQASINNGSDDAGWEPFIWDTLTENSEFQSLCYGYYDFVFATGTTVRDRINSNNLTINTSLSLEPYNPWWPIESVRASRGFGSGGFEVKYADSTGLVAANVRSVFFMWMNGGAGQSGNSTLWSNIDSSGLNGIVIYFNDTNDTIGIDARDGTGSVCSGGVEGVETFALGEVVEIEARWDYTSGGTAEIWINGTKYTTSTFSSAITPTLQPRLGVSRDTTNFNNGIGGYFGPYLIFNTKLTDNWRFEIREFMVNHLSLSLYGFEKAPLPVSLSSHPIQNNTIFCLPFPASGNYSDIGTNGRATATNGTLADYTANNEGYGLDTTSGCVRSPNWFDVTDFTNLTVMIRWIPNGTNTSAQYLFGARAGSNSYFTCYQNASSTTLQFEVGSASFSSSSGVVNGQLNTLFLVKSGTTVTAYLNGSNVGSTTAAFVSGEINYYLTVGDRYDAPGTHYYQGYIFHFHITSDAKSLDDNDYIHNHRPYASTLSDIYTISPPAAQLSATPSGQTILIQPGGYDYHKALRPTFAATGAIFSCQDAAGTEKFSDTSFFDIDMSNAGLKQQACSMNNIQYCVNVNGASGEGITITNLPANWFTALETTSGKVSYFGIWIKVDSWETTNVTTLFSIYDADGADGDAIAVKRLASSNNIVIGSINNTADDSTSVPITLGEWTHISIIRDHFNNGQAYMCVGFMDDTEDNGVPTVTWDNDSEVYDTIEIGFLSGGKNGGDQWTGQVATIMCAGPYANESTIHGRSSLLDFWTRNNQFELMAKEVEFTWWDFLILEQQPASTLRWRTQDMTGNACTMWHRPNRSPSFTGTISYESPADPATDLDGIRSVDFSADGEYIKYFLSNTTSPYTGRCAEFMFRLNSWSGDDTGIALTLGFEGTGISTMEALCLRKYPSINELRLNCRASWTTSSWVPTLGEWYHVIIYNNESSNQGTLIVNGQVIIDAETVNVVSTAETYRTIGGYSTTAGYWLDTSFAMYSDYTYSLAPLKSQSIVHYGAALERFPLPQDIVLDDVGTTMSFGTPACNPFLAANVEYNPDAISLTLGNPPAEPDLAYDPPDIDLGLVGQKSVVMLGDLINDLQIPIEWMPEINQIQFYIPIQWVLAPENINDLEIPIEWTPISWQPYIPIKWDVNYQFTPYIDIEWLDLDTNYPRSFAQWTAVVSIDGTDFSGRLTGNLLVDYQEDMSGIAEFEVVPNPGVIDIMSWMSKVVTINVELRNSSGTLIRSDLLYTGKILAADYDPENVIIDFSATNDLQGYFENMLKDDIKSALGVLPPFDPATPPNPLPSAWWSPFVFNDEDVDGWELAEDIMTTNPASLWLDKNLNLKITPWAAKAVPDFTFTDDSRFDNTLRLRRATRRDLINNVRLGVDYKYSRLRQRQIDFYLNDPNNLCERFEAQYGWPTKQSVIDAIESSGWTLQGNIQFNEMPQVQFTRCPATGLGLYGAVYFFTNLDGSYITDAEFTLSRRWVQTVVERYTINVKAQDSIDYSGLLNVDRNIAVESDYDDTDWEYNKEYEGYDPAAVEVANGDYVVSAADFGEEGTSIDLDNAQKTMINHCKTEILRTHRKNTVRFEVPYNPAVTLENTVQVEADYLTAKGKVKQVRHRFNIDNGDATTEITIAISAHGGQGLVTDSPLNPIDPPVETVTDVYEKFVYGTVYIGGAKDSTPYDENTFGYYTNTRRGTYDTNGISLDQQNAAYGWDISNPYHISYDFDGLQLVTPEITGDSVEVRDLEANSDFEVEIPQDILIITAGV